MPTTDRPILFSAPMIQALLDGRKTQTRRLINPQPATFQTEDGECEVKAVQIAGEAMPRIATGRVITLQKIRFAVGDRLWVKETWAVASVFIDVVEVRYRASERGSHSEYVEQVPIERATKYTPTWPKWKPSLFMQRWASRLTLTVTDVRVERLQDISEADAKAEGVEMIARRNYRDGYAVLWNSLHDKPGERWDDNPWVVAISFDVRKGNIDA